MVKKLCCIFNIASHYREPIYKKIDDQFDCDFFIGDNVKTPLKKMSYQSLQGFKKTLINKYIWNFYWQKGIESTFSSKYSDYIITGDPFCISNWILLIYCNLTKKKTFLWSHGWYGNESFLKIIIKKIFFNLGSKVLLYGNYAKELMLKQGFKEKDLVTIYNSLDFDYQNDIYLNLKKSTENFSLFNNDFPTVIYVGRIQKVKKIDFLFKSVKELEKHDIKCNVLLVGKIVDDFKLSQIVDELDLKSRVIFYGPCFDEEKLASLFYNSHVCVSPGNVGLTAIHSLTYGTPVITHNNFVNQMPEFEIITEGFTGSFFEEDNIQNLAFIISKYLNVSLEEKLSLSDNRRRIIEEYYNCNFQINELLKLINE
ncbi:glycosyltransferase [Mongoliibacter ruber]|uniref:Glycosyl transferase family 1 n=1 Tax=Mongoliibacter ruber TaxID=1750599 RepID=A0A2T0WPB6_9BACT|nr:glycosyltransferase [Mongoliibacter ruber]PRY88364.1 glycosyl transferase family 1 [Mongoliibacter ruber]